MNFLELAEERYSVRSYSNKPIEEEKIKRKKGDYRDVDSIGYGKCYSDLCAAAQSDCEGTRHGCIEGRGKASDCPADGGRCGSQHHDGKYNLSAGEGGRVY